MKLSKLARFLDGKWNERELVWPYPVFCKRSSNHRDALMICKRIIFCLFSRPPERAQLRGIDIEFGYANPQKIRLFLRCEDVFQMAIVKRLKAAMGRAFSEG